MPQILSILPQDTQLLINGFLHDCAMLNVDNFSAGYIQKSDVPCLGIVSYMIPGLAAIMIHSWRSYGFQNRRRVNFADSPKSIFHLFFLDGQLIRIMDVLITAAAAYAIITADGIRPQGDGLMMFRISAAQKVFFRWVISISSSSPALKKEQKRQGYRTTDSDRQKPRFNFYHRSIFISKQCSVF
jgi:hypothetical protein